MKFYNFLEELKTGKYLSDGDDAVFNEEDKTKLLGAVPFAFVKSEQTDRTVEPYSGEPLDLPFPVCFFEVIDGIISTMTNSSSVREISLSGLAVVEIAPRKYNVYLLMEDPHQRAGSLILYSEQREVVEHSLGMVRHLLDRLAKDEIGFTNPRKHFKMKIGGKKVDRRIDKIVYVSPKKFVTSAESSAGRVIDWSHQWTVRGHWRSLQPSRVGRDRAGDPIIGFTWVRPHTKGPENAPLIQKTRVVLGDK